MISQDSGFKLEDRGFRDTLVLIPGWAADYRVFSALRLNYNYLFAIDNNLLNFGERLLALLDKKSLDKVSIFGWSLGGFLGADFASKNPKRINELILVSIRKKFNGLVLNRIKSQLEKNKKAYLYKFYLECFSDKEKESLVWFRRNLLKDYISVFKLDDLIEGLDYLSKSEIVPESLAKINNLRIFHGLKDKIAPVKEIKEIELALPRADFVYLPKAGHLPFLTKNFNQRFYGNK